MKKVILAFILGLSLSTISVVALSLCNAKDIEFNASDATWDIDTVSDALNDLYRNKNTSDSCNNVAEPNLGDETKLIPVIISDDGTITKVSKNNSDWYNYCEKKWANAVTLNDGVPVPSDNQEIDMKNIESMFVWVPKYKYKLWNVNPNSEGSLAKVHTIEIIFDTTDTIDKEGESCKTPMNEDNSQGLSGDIKNCSNGEYMTHPAFISFGVDGFWVGKFETGHKTATSTAQAQTNSNSSDLIVIKPSVFSWRYNTIKNMFEAAYNYERDLDSHMMKNTEWGAVAYLSHSKYEINREVNVNNNSSYKTGYSALPSTNQQTFPGIMGDDNAYNQQWDTNVGYLASTTGNISGVYDMSGGVSEYVAGYVVGNYSHSGFSKLTFDEIYTEKYYDSYKSGSSDTSYQNMILGDATGEIGPFQNFITGKTDSNYFNNWYGDHAYFVNSTYSWFGRGGCNVHGVVAGQFNFGNRRVINDDKSGSRLVLAPKN